MKKLRISLFLLFGIVQWSISLSAQPVMEWEVNLGGSEHEKVWDVLEDNEGNLIVVGFTTSIDGDIIGSKGGNDVWIVKLDNLGKKIWAKNYGGTKNDGAYSVLETNDGGYIVSGFTGSSDGDVKSGNHGGSYDVWLFKITKDGDLIWEQTYGGSKEERGWSVQQSKDGGYIVAVETNSNDGDVSSNYGQSDYWLIKVDEVGNLVWEKNYGGSVYDFVENVIITSKDEIILSGDSGSNDGDVNSSNDGCDFWILKVDSQGSILSNRLYGGNSIEIDPYIIETSDGGFMLGGSSASIDGDVTNNYGSSDYWVVKLDEMGEILWERNYGGTDGEVVNGIQETSAGTYVIVGSSLSNDVDVGGNYGDHDFWVLEVDDTGQIIWEQNYGGSKLDIPRSLAISTDGGIIVAGDSFSDDGDVGGNNGGRDFWLIKLSYETGLGSTKDQSRLEIFPNPSNGDLSILIEDKPGKKNIEIIDTFGKVIHSEKSSANQIAIKNIPAGFYILRVIHNGKFIAKKFIVH